MHLFNLFLAILFFLSFHAKRKNIADLKYEILSYHFIPSRAAKSAAYCLLCIELTISVLYIINALYMVKAILAGTLILFFTLATLYKQKIDGLKSCNCFGNLTWLNKFPIQRNLIILVIIGFVFVLQIKYNIHSPNIVLDGIYVLTIAYVLDFILLWSKVKRRREGLNG